MHAGLLREERRPFERLDHEVVGDVSREAKVHGRVDERLHDEEDVGRPGPADRGGHRDHLLVVDLELEAERPEQCGRLGALRLGRLGGGVPDRHALAEAGGRIRHAADHLVVPEDPGEGRGRGAGEDAQDQLAAAQVGTDLAADLVQHLGLDAQQDHVRVPHRVEVVGHGPDAVFARKGVAALGSGMARDDACRLDERAAQQARDHGLGHDPRADRGDRRVREGGHRPEYSDAVAGLLERLTGSRRDRIRRREPLPSGRSGRSW